MTFRFRLHGKRTFIPGILLGSVLLGTFFLLPGQNALAIDAPVLDPLTSTCGGVTGDGSSNPQAMVGPGGPLIHLSWNSVSGAANYQVWRKVGSGSWEEHGSLLPAGINSLADQLVSTLPDAYHLSATGNLQYYVQAISSTGEVAGGPDDAKSISIPQCIPFLQVNPVCDPNDRGFYLRFTATRDVALYDVFRGADGSPSIVQLNVTPDFGARVPGLFFYVDGVIDETAPPTKYWVEAAGSEGQRWKSNEVTSAALDCTSTASAPDPPPKMSKMDPRCENGTESRIYLEWEPSNNVDDGYTVWRRVKGDAGDGEARVTTNPEDLFWNDNTEGHEGKDFEYRIEAVGTGGSSWSPWEPGNNPENNITDLDKGTAPLCGTPSPPPDFRDGTPESSCIAGVTGVDIAWVKSVGAEKYEILRQAPGESELTTRALFLPGSDEFDNTQEWRDESIVSNETYFYQVVAHGPTGTTPSNSTVESVETFDCSLPGDFSINEPVVLQCSGPILEAKTSGDTGISWTASTNAASYDLSRKKASDGSGVTHSGVTSPYLDSGFGDAVSAVFEEYSWQAKAQGPGGTKLSVETALYSAPVCEPGKPAVTLTPVCEPGVGSAMLVEWTYALNTVSYEISRDGSPVAQFDRGVDAEFDSRSWTDTDGGGGLAPLVSYAYTVRAIGPTGLEKISDPASEIASDCSPPTIPQNVTAEFVCIGVGDTSPPRARVRWDDSDHATSYDVWRDNDDDGVPDIVIASVSDDGSPTYEILDPIAVNTKYAYYIKAIGPGGESDFSVAAVVDPATHLNSNYCKPPAPIITSLTTMCTGGDPENTLFWTAEPTPNNTASYEIYRSEVDSIPGTPLASGIISTTWTDPTLTSPGDISTTFYYWIKAVGDGPTTLKSDASASKSTQTLACGVAPDPPVISITDNQCVPGTGRPAITLDWADTTNTISYNVYRDGALTYQNRWHPFKDNGSHALEFDGGDDAVKVENSLSLDELSAFTVALWIYSDTGSGRLAEKQDGLGNDEWRWFMNGPNALRFQYTPNGGDWDISIGGGFSFIGAWHHVVLTYDNSSPDNNPVMYVDGVPRTVSETAAPGALTAGQDDPLFIGGRSSGSDAVDGKLDDVRIYNRALTGAEISDLYNGDFVSPYGLVGMWHFDEGSGMSAKDDSGNGNDGTRQNDPMWIQLTSSDPSHDSDPLANSTPYAYKVRALGVDTNSPSSDSNTESETTLDCGPLDQAPDVVLQCDANTVLPFIALSWIADDNAQYWDLFRKKTSEDDTKWAPIATGLITTTYDDKTVEAGEEYHYFLEATGYQGESSCDPDGCEVSASIVADQGVACDAPPKPLWVNEGTFPYCSGNVPRNRMEWSGTLQFLQGGGKYYVHRKKIEDNSTMTFDDGGDGVGQPILQSSAGDIGIFLWFADNDLGAADSGKEFEYQVQAIGGGNTLSDLKIIETKANCATLPPEQFNAFINLDLGIISRGDLREIPLKWTSAQTEEYFKVFRTDGFDTEEKVITAVNDNLFTEVPGSKLERGVDYIDGLAPGANCTVTNCVFSADSETSSGPSPVTIDRMEDDLHYAYRVIAFKSVAGASCPLTGEADLRCRGADTAIALLPAARPGVFDLRVKAKNPDEPSVTLEWDASVYTQKGGVPIYSVEWSRTQDFQKGEGTPVQGCQNIAHAEPTMECKDLNPRRGITYYRVFAENTGGVTPLGSENPQSVQAGLYLFPEEFREISPF